MIYLIYTLLFASLVVNCFFGWFIYRTLLRHSDLVALVEDLEYKIDFFRQHLESLYELPMFYGEPTVQNLIEHSQVLLSSFEKFNNDYDFFNGEEEDYELQTPVENQIGSG